MAPQLQRACLRWDSLRVFYVELRAVVFMFWLKQLQWLALPRAGVIFPAQPMAVFKWFFPTFPDITPSACLSSSTFGPPQMRASVDKSGRLANSLKNWRKVVLGFDPAMHLNRRLLLSAAELSVWDICSTPASGLLVQCYCP